MELDITYIDKQLYHRKLRGGLGRGHSFLLFATILSSDRYICLGGPYRCLCKAYPIGYLYTSPQMLPAIYIPEYANGRPSSTIVGIVRL